MSKDEEKLKEAIQRLAPSQTSSGSSGAQALARTLYIATEIANETSKKNHHEAVLADLTAIRDALKYAEWKDFWSSPIIKKEDREGTLKEMFDKIGASEITRQFFSRVVDNKATKLVPEIIAIHASLLSSQKNEITAEVVSAHELKESEKQTIIDTLATYEAEGPGAKVQINLKVDPSLLGGFVMTVGSTYVDMSLKSQIDAMRSAFLAHVTSKADAALLRAQ